MSRSDAPADEPRAGRGRARARISDELGLPEPERARHARSDAWVEVVGADVAAHAHLESVRDGVATITADGPLWASQLRYLERAIVDGATAVVGPGVVRSVRVRVGG